MKTEPLTPEQIQRLAELGFTEPLNRPEAETKARALLAGDTTQTPAWQPPPATSWTLSDWIFCIVVSTIALPGAILVAAVATVFFAIILILSIVKTIWSLLPLTRKRSATNIGQ